jgi:predicted permease
MDLLRSRFSKPLFLLAGVAAIVLLITCVNISNLLLARGTARRREFAIRVATGARAGRVVRQLLAETVLLFLCGSVAAAAVCLLVVEALTGFFAIGRNPIVLDVEYGGRLLSYAVALTLTTALFTGLWPAFRAAQVDPQPTLKDSEARLARGGSRAIRHALVVAQVALCVVLLVSAAMFVQSMIKLRTIDLGFTARQVLTMSLDPDVGRQNAAATREQFWSRVLDAVRRLPAVNAASLSVLTPLSGRDTGMAITVPEFDPKSDEERIVHLNHVSEDYFRTFGIGVIAGRAFTAGDGANSPRVVMLNETAAATYYPGRSAIGETLSFGKAGLYQVIGIVRDHKHMSVRRDAPRFAFVPLRQRVDSVSRITLAVKSEQAMAAVLQVVTREVYGVHPRTLISDVIRVEEQIDATLVSERLLSTLASAFAALALALAGIGLYGVLSYTVARRRNELGIRLALGARRGHVASSVLRDVALQVLAGVLIGIPVAAIVTRIAGDILFGVTPTDAWSYVVSVLILTGVAALAAWLPTRRALMLDPITAIRAD